MVTTRKKRSIQEREGSSILRPRKKLEKEKPTMQASKSTPAEDPRLYDVDFVTRYDYMDLVSQRLRLIESGCMGWVQPDGNGDMDKDYQALVMLPRYWLGTFAAETQDEDRLSADQKKMIISSLKGSCIQEDWDVLKARVPELIWQRFPEVLLNTFLMREIYTKFLEASFWYFDGKTGPSDQAGDDSFAARLEYLYQRYLKTNPYSAGVWRSETIRLANSVDCTQAPDYELGHYHQDRRAAALGSMMDDFLAREPICWLLKKPLSKEEEIDRRKRLTSTYQRAAHISPAHGATRGFLEFHRLDKLEETFHVASDMLQAHEYHFLKGGDTRLDGRRILLVVRPAIIRRWITEDRHDERQIVSKAIVVVEDPQVQNGTKVEDQKDDKAEDQA